MTDTGTQQEPSMEEILSSIRRIISSDDEEGEEVPTEAAPEDTDTGAVEMDQGAVDNLFDEPAAEPDAGAVEMDQGAVDNLFDEPAAPAPEPEPEPEPAPEPEPEPEDDVLELTEVVEEPEPEPEPEPDFDITEELVSPPTAAASVASLASLNEVVATGMVPFDVGGRTVEQLAGELMRPMLREWLDQNLPMMVERLVRAEIKRLSEESKRR